APRAKEAGTFRPPQAPKRTRGRDPLPHVGREVPCQLARIDAAEAPADQADAPSMTAPDLLQPLDETAHHRRRRAEVPAELPAVYRVAEVAEEPAERAGREVTRHEAGKDEHRMAVAARGASQERVGRDERRELEEGAALEEEQTAAGRRDLHYYACAGATRVTYISTIGIHSNRVPRRRRSIRARSYLGLPIHGKTDGRGKRWRAAAQLARDHLARDHRHAEGRHDGPARASAAGTARRGVPMAGNPPPLLWYRAPWPLPCSMPPEGSM